MNRVAVQAEEVPLPCSPESIADYATRVLAEINRDNWDLSLLFCGDETMRALNAQYRNKDEATDVLSFNLGVEETAEDGTVRYLPGDIVISLETLKENAAYFEISTDEELRRLLIHGILHLDGMDHSTNERDEPMLVLQEQILTKLKGEIPLAETVGADK